MKLKINVTMQFLLCVCMAALCSCNLSSPKKSNGLETKHTEIMGQIENYLKSNSDSRIVMEDVLIAKNLILEALKDSNYVVPKGDIFQEHVRDIFNIDSHDSCYTILRHDSFFTYVITDYNFIVMEGITESNKYQKRLEHSESLEFYNDENVIFAKEGFIFYPFKVRDIITKKKDGSLTVDIPESIIHRNKFLFNNSNASLTWLIHNDEEFLETLVKEFGYDKNEKINQLVLQMAQKSYKRYNDISSECCYLFAKKQECSSKLYIREGLLKTMMEMTEKEMTEMDDPNGKILELTSNYAYYLVNFDYLSNYTHKERFKIASYLGYYIQLLYNKTQNIPMRWDPGSFFRNELVSNKRLLEEIEKNQYYGLPNFKDMIEAVLEQIKIESEIYFMSRPWARSGGEESGGGEEE